MASINRAIALGIHEKSYDWRKAIENSKRDYDSYDGLKRYCAELMPKKVPLQEELILWVTALRDEMIAPPKRPRGAPKTGRQYNMYLPRLVHRVYNRFGLKPTRSQSSDPLSACDAVKAAINSIPAARKRIASKSYVRLAAEYKDAKRIGALVG